MSIAIITDTHFGVRNESAVWLKAHAVMLDKFFKDLDNKGIRKIWMLGDLVDSRKSVSSRLLSWIHQNWTKPIIEREISVEMILGNHDTFYRSTNHPNIPAEIFGSYPEIHVHTDGPVEIRGPKGKSVLMVPWIIPSEEEQTVKMLKSTTYDVVCGHFDIIGGLMQGTQISEHGLNQEVFKNHGLVLSGHYHKRSTMGNIHYLGNPVATNWSEASDQHGWSTYDGDTLEFHPFDYPLYKKIHINSKEPISEYVDDGSSFVKIFVRERNEFYLQQLVSQIRSLDHVLQLQIIDDTETEVENVEFTDEDLRDDLLSLMHKTVDSSSIENGDAVKRLLSELHSKSQSMNLI